MHDTNNSLPEVKPRSVTILGSTGSIGVSAVKLLSCHRERFTVEALTAQENVKLLAEQALILNAKYAVIGNEMLYAELKNLLSDSHIKIAAGKDAIIDAAKIDSDVVLAAIVGFAGLLPTLAAIERGAIIALANKECLVCAGSLMMEKVRAHNATIIPVDSEHSAIFQVFNFDKPETVEKIIITASGGPFRTFTLEQMKKVTPEQAIRHPNWDMGAKISVDSATMMNKGLEIIEAYHLFPIKESQIEVLVHPESIIHSLVSYIDGSVLAQLGTPDMCTPIAHALAWPNRISTPTEKIDFTTLKTLHFEQPDMQKFPALKLAYEALKAGGSLPTILNAANEIAVSRFLKKEIGFLDIVHVIETVLAQLTTTPLHEIGDVVEIDKHSRDVAQLALQ
jgi:1-deoxy-D-xylulose-5-phosphate reductoisomerase